MKLSEKIHEAVAALESLRFKTSSSSSTLRPCMAPYATPHTVLILGSGLDSLVSLIDEQFSVSYHEIPHCKTTRMSNHQGRFIFGTLAGESIICLQGRLHVYEGNTPLETVFPLLVAHKFGASRLIVTNAAGAINEKFCVGDLMLITDHINFTAASPVTFDADNDMVATSLDMTYAYTPILRRRALAAAETLGLTLREGIYLGLRGPMFETPAEIRMFRGWGADAVGMSTVHEVIMASALHMHVCGISLLTNMAAGMLDQVITAEEVVKTAAASADNLGRLIAKLV